MVEKSPWPVAKIIAHRGASAVAPENTLSALIKAKELGATWVQADVRLTLDDEAVIFHDDTLERCTNGRGLVRKTQYAIIRGLDAGSWFSHRYSGEKIPTLDHWLQAAAAAQLGIILNLHSTWFGVRRLTDHVVSSLSRYWRGDLPQPLIASESVSCLKRITALQLGWNLAYVMPEERRGWQKIVREYRCLAVHIDHQFISERWLQELKQQKLYIAAYTVNDPHRAEQLFDLGIDSVFTDDPRLLTPGFTPHHH